MNVTGHRELLMASELVSEPDDDGSFEVTIEVSEAGWADLSRLQLLAVSRSAATAGGADILPLTLVEAIRVHNTRELIRGQGNTVGAPAGVFSPFRQYGAIQLGKWWLEGGNLVSIRLRSDLPHPPKGGSRNLVHSAAFPFQPDNQREYQVMADFEQQPRAYVASPVAKRAKHQSTCRLEVRFDQDGIVDLDSLQLFAGETPAAGDEERNIVATVVESIELSTRQELILGGTTAHPPPRAVPGAVFASLGRRFNWVLFGDLQVSTNNTLVVRLKPLTKPSAKKAEMPRFSMGLQFYPGL